MIIKVTEEHIKKGERCNVNMCPVALALRGDTHISVEVDADTIFVNDKLYKTPIEVVKFINNFDEEEDVSPFEFELND